jgi:coenzyme F420-dependent glucose-6-phosphate dehydrogenase
VLSNDRGFGFGRDGGGGPREEAAAVSGRLMAPALHLISMSADRFRPLRWTCRPEVILYEEERMLRLGWKAATEQFRPDELLDFAIAAEEAGFDSIDASDHFHPWSEAGQASFVWTWLGAVAARTSRIQLGTGLTCPILRYHPAVIAQAAATLSQLAPHRVYLAVGTGEALNEYAATALWPPYRERQARLAEAIELILLLWAGDEVTYRGRYYQTRRARLYTRPAAPIPLVISSMVPDSAAFAGRHGDGLLTVGGKEPRLYHEMLRRFDDACREAGKDPADLPRQIELSVEYTDDPETAIAHRKTYWAGVYVPALFTERIYTPRMSAQNGEAVGADTIRRTACISADAGEHARFARRYIDAGFNQIFFHSATPDQRAFLAAYGRDVLPQIRSRVTAAVDRAA